MGSTSPKCLVTQILEINSAGWCRWKKNHCSKFEKSIPYALLIQVAGQGFTSTFLFVHPLLLAMFLHVDAKTRLSGWQSLKVNKLQKPTFAKIEKGQEPSVIQLFFHCKVLFFLSGFHRHFPIFHSQCTVFATFLAFLALNAATLFYNST